MQIHCGTQTWYLLQKYTQLANLFIWNPLKSELCDLKENQAHLTDCFPYHHA